MVRNMHELPSDVVYFLIDLRDNKLSETEWNNLPELLGFTNRVKWKWVLRGNSPWPKEAIIKLASLIKEDPAEMFCRYEFFQKGFTIDDARAMAQEAGDELHLTTEPHAA